MTLIVLSGLFRCLQVSVLPLHALITSLLTHKCLETKGRPGCLLLLIWPAASGQSEAGHHNPLSVAASHRLVTPGRPAGPATDWALLTIPRMRSSHFHLLIMRRQTGGLQQAAGTNICMHFYEAPCLLGPSPLCLVSDSCLVGGGRDC